MRVAAFSIQPYDRESLTAASAGLPLEWTWLEPRLDARTARLAQGATAVNCFVNDDLDAAALEALAAAGVRLVTLRCAGFNQVDLAAAARLGLPVTRVPEYSPHAVAEHTVGLILMLDRRLHKAYNRVREGNFSLDGLLGFASAGPFPDGWPAADRRAAQRTGTPVDQWGNRLVDLRDDRALRAFASARMMAPGTEPAAPAS